VSRRGVGRRLFVAIRTAVWAGAVLFGVFSSEAKAFKLFGFSFFEPERQAPSPDAQTYSIDLAVATPDQDIIDVVRGASLLYSGKDDTPPPSTPAFLSRARAEYERILAALYAEGYYGGTIAIAVAGRALESIPADATLPHPVPVRIDVKPGPRFAFGTIVMKNRVPLPIADEDRAVKTPEKLGLVPGGVAKSEIVLASEQALIDEWRQQGHPKAQASPRNVVANHKTDRLDVAIGVRPGPAAVYGATAVTGTTDMDPAFIAYVANLVPGEPYDPDDLERALKRLRDLQVFSSTRIVEADAVGPGGTLPLTIAVVERPLHVFGAGGSYSTLDGLGVDGYWEHRNLFGHAERLRFEGRVAGIDSTDPRDFTYLGAMTFVKPAVFTPTTDLIAVVSASREVYDPYSQNTFRARLGLAHEFFPGLTGKVALNGEFDHVDDAFGERDLTLASLPSELFYDDTDNRLEPTRGYRARLSLEPFHEFEFGNSGVFGKVEGSTYLALDENGRFIVAARAALGSIFGAPADELPADRLFFAGGGGSVRGYAYRSIGPRLANGRIVGGLSLAEASLELRLRVTETIGIVPFVDAGNAFASRLPDFSDELKVGAGVGVRYYTGIGAIRVDVATPVNPDRDDSRFALYVGLGESF
jgi:translocation and assembly module TamA